MSLPVPIEPAHPSELSELIRSLPHLVLRGGGTKPALSLAPGSIPAISLRRMSGIVTFHPLDFSVTALAGTPLAELVAVLASVGQGLPFEPPCLGPSATLGGCAATSFDGPGAFRAGGVKDHLLAVQFCDGRGQLLRSGARVLKNSAGPPLAGFLPGTLGRFAALTELTFRTRPLPEAAATIVWPCNSLERATTLLADLGSSSGNFEALDLEIASPDDPLHLVLGRISGRAAAVTHRAQRIVETSRHPAFSLSPEDSASRWNRRLHLEWVPPRYALVKIPVPLSGLAAFDSACASLEALRTYTHGGRLAWVALPAPALLESALHSLGLRGLLVLSPSTFTGSPFLGKWSPSALMRRLKKLFDPDAKFPSWPEAEGP